MTNPRTSLNVLKDIGKTTPSLIKTVGYLNYYLHAPLNDALLLRTYFTELNVLKVCVFVHCRYAYLLLIMNYIFPLVTLSVTYTRVGFELWGSRAIGEDISMQHDRVKAKRKVLKFAIL